MAKKKVCRLGKKVDEVVFKTIEPFKYRYNYWIEVERGYGAGFTTIDGKRHFKVSMSTQPRGNARVVICETGGKSGYVRRTADFGCKKVILDKNTKVKNGVKMIDDFVRENDLLILARDESEAKDIRHMTTSPSQKRHFEEVKHCAQDYTGRYHEMIEDYDELKSNLKGRWHTKTWGNADRDIPSHGIKQGQLAVEYHEYKIKKGGK